MVFITRIVLKNYRSISACDCSLGPLTFVVGPNGAGKANLLDALRFVRDALRDSLADAVDRRGGFAALRRWSAGRAGPVGVQVDFTLPLVPEGRLAFLLEGRRDGTVEVLREECVVHPRGGGAHHYRVLKGAIVSTDHSAATVPRDRLYLEEAAVSGPFRLVHGALAGMGQLGPARTDRRVLRKQPPYPGSRLRAAAAPGEHSPSALAWAEEAARRDEEMDERRDSGIPADQVFEELRRKGH